MAAQPPNRKAGPDSGRPVAESGHIMAMTAMLLIPLMSFAALATDIGGWYGEAAKIQRASDAAAMAGVALFPNESAAAAEAVAVAARNGYVDQPGCDTLPCTPTSYPQVITTRVDSRRLRVDIIATANVFFGRVVMDDDITVQRSATAERIPDLPIGNPTSALGTGSDVGVDGFVANHWLRASAECGLRLWGDFIGASGGCPSTNPNYRAEGHTFVVEVPLDGSYDVQARLTCWEIGYGGMDAQGSMRFRLFPSDNTPYDDDDNVLLPMLAEVTVDRPSTSICPSDGSGWGRNLEPAPWITIDTVNSAGRYVMQAKNVENYLPQANYSLRVVPTGSGDNVSCSRIGPSGTSGCPNIQAKDYLTATTHNDLYPPGPIGLSTIYIAEVSSDYAGNTLRVEMFDPADGIDIVRIRDPQGNYASFTWFSIDCQVYAYNCGAGDYGTETSQISQTCGGASCVTQSGGYSFQDRTIYIDIPLADGYTCSTPPGEPENCWWQVEYEDNDSSLHDTTTWGATIAGDPIRLVN